LVSTYLPKSVIHKASDGKQAVEMYLAHTYDVVFMDLQMPVMNGYDATRKIREIEKETGMHVPIIALTAAVLSGEKEKCLEVGMDDFLQKPLDVDLLGIVIHKYLHANSDSSLEQISIEQSTHDIKEQDVLMYDKEMAEKKYGDAKFVRELVLMALESLPPYIKALSDAIQEKNVEQIKFNIHTMKGVSRGIYFNRFFEICKSIEEDMFTDVSKFEMYFELISKEYEAVNSYVMNERYV
jgi:CheY-like chemotaxis protein